MFYFHLENWGNDPIWLIFFRWVETTKQFCFFQWVFKKKVQQTQWTLWWFVGTRISYSEIEVVFWHTFHRVTVREWNSAPSKSKSFPGSWDGLKKMELDSGGSMIWLVVSPYHLFFIFIPIWGNDPIWLFFFSNGLKLPTRWWMIEVLLQLIDKPHWFLFFLVRECQPHFCAGVFWGGRGSLAEFCNLHSLIYILWSNYSVTDLKVAEEGKPPVRE